MSFLGNAINKARENVRNYDGVRFEESKAVFEDPYAITITDEESDPFEQRFVSIGIGALGRSIRLDRDVVDHFLGTADESEGAIGYPTLINDALRQSIEAPSLEAMVRRAIREELKAKPF